MAQIDELALQKLLEPSANKGRPRLIRRAEVSDLALLQAAKRLEVALPHSYCAFVTRMGTVVLDDELTLLPPEELYDLDIPDTPFNGWIVIAIDGTGNLLAFDPDDPMVEGERHVKYVSHDPFGHGVLAPTFAALIEQLAASSASYLGALERLARIEEVDAPPQLRKPWWKLW
ncbi:SMI1 / KNR4 family (SUKH-1) [Andreprevotia lacus DSM 23236]|jgi:hypothetical protein|uniref:SMI1 / KNR4 family (SUKH-1) n=1 Tax=Andreprevotia lacus DSM 23236 TaxID=1121001 RepID=A0A1W1X8S3_9NEIS|nr:SMI1/KNR4 family protein [Andreprevotia lacus]SMC20224.1 SMI1 / KNR4 family (SUKH-1) [Andreprevotia lacus DSM 23236]